MAVGLLLAVCAAGLVWHQDLTQIFVARQVEDNREEAAQDTGRLISHRGMCDVAPENSLPAFRLAGEWGYWGVECDISVTISLTPASFPSIKRNILTTFSLGFILFFFFFFVKEI